MLRYQTAMLILLGLCSATAIAGDGKQARKCDQILPGDQCLQHIDGKVYIDGVEVKVVRHTAVQGERNEVTLPPPPQGVARIATTYDQQVLADFVKKGEPQFGLPQFYVVDLQTGAPAALADLPAPFAEFVRRHVRSSMNTLHPDTSPGLLDALLKVSRHADGTPMQRAELAGKRFAAFQLWAPWCIGCMEEAKELTALLEKTPMPELAWIALEADPSELDMPVAAAPGPAGPAGEGAQPGVKTVVRPVPVRRQD